MATLTNEQKEQRAATRKLNREIAKAAYEKQLEEQAKQEEEFRKSVPAKLTELKELAKSLGVATVIDLTPTGPEISFEYESTVEDIYINDTLTYDSDEYWIRQMESNLNNINVKREALEIRKALAREAWNKLSKEEQDAIKEFRWSIL